MDVNSLMLDVANQYLWFLGKQINLINSFQIQIWYILLKNSNISHATYDRGTSFDVIRSYKNTLFFKKYFLKSC